MNPLEKFIVKKQNEMVINGLRVSGFVVVDTSSNKILTKPMSFKDAYAYRDSMIKTTKGE